MAHTIAVVVGSTRSASNTVGLASFLTHAIAAKHPGKYVFNTYSATTPLNVVAEPINSVSPAAVTSADKYESSVVQAWSRAVSAADALLVVSPVYNAAPSGHIKIMVDHIYNEFKDKPVAIITQGPSRPDLALQAMENLLNKASAKIIFSRDVRIPKDYVMTSRRFAQQYAPQGPDEEFLSTLAPLVDELTAKIDAAVSA